MGHAELSFIDSNYFRRGGFQQKDGRHGIVYSPFLALILTPSKVYCLSWIDFQLEFHWLIVLGSPLFP